MQVQVQVTCAGAHSCLNLSLLVYDSESIVAGFWVCGVASAGARAWACACAVSGASAGADADACAGACSTLNLFGLRCVRNL